MLKRTAVEFVAPKRTPLIVQDAALRERLVVAKMNLVISGSPLDEALAAGLMLRKADVLSPRRQALADALEIVTAWHAREHENVDWVRPDAGALCCFRLTSTYSDAAVERFWASLPGLDLQLAPGTWFGHEDRVFRLGFGYAPLETLIEGLSSLSLALDRAKHA